MNFEKPKRCRMFAGPNGSGKSFLINEINKKFNLGYLINADFVEKKLNQHRFLDCSEFIPCHLDKTSWDKYLSSPEIKNRIGPRSFPSFRVQENIFITEKKISSYDAAIICDVFRKILLDYDETFSFETVMSHSSKTDFLLKAKEKDFKTYLYYICTPDPQINISRVRDRSLKGGHDVPQKKIVERYYRSLELLASAFKNADRAFIIDSTLGENDVIVEKEGNTFQIKSENIPGWINKYLLKKLNAK